MWFGFSRFNTDFLYRIVCEQTRKMFSLKMDNKLAVAIILVAAICGLVQCVRVEVSSYQFNTFFEFSSSFNAKMSISVVISLISSSKCGFSLAQPTSMLFAGAFLDFWPFFEARMTWSYFFTFLRIFGQLFFLQN